MHTEYDFVFKNSKQEFYLKICIIFLVPTTTTTTTTTTTPNPCLSSPCQNGGTCSAWPGGAGYYCNCPCFYGGLNCQIRKKNTLLNIYEKNDL